MNISVLQYVVVCVYFVHKFCEAAYFSDVHWSTAIKLSQYESYRSVTLLSYNIPDQTAEVAFTFQAKTSGKTCTFREVHVYLQHGSYPLVTPYNETYPDKFFTNRTDSFHLKIEKNADAVSYMMSSPRPGIWYFAAFLPKSDYEKIRQHGFEKSCEYGMFVIVESRGFDIIEEISTDKAHHIHLQQSLADSQAYYRYVLPKDTVEYTVRIDSCVATLLDTEQDTGNSTSMNQTSTSSQTVNCPVVIRVEAEMLPSLRSVTSATCGNLTSCEVKTLSPTLHKWTYILLTIDNNFNVSDVHFKLQFEKKGCESLKFMLPRTIYKATTSKQQPNTTHLSQDSCIKMASLGRFIFDQQTFNITYLLSNTGQIPIPASLDNIHVPDYQVIVTDISVQEPTDIGGTLKLDIGVIKSSLDIKSHSIVIYMCLMKNAIPGGQTVVSCENGVHIVLNTTSQLYQDTAYIPYPEPGVWYLALNSRCFSIDSKVPVRCLGAPEVNIDLSISGCLEGQCGEYGICQDYISGVHVFSSCKCFAGWRGYGCTDGTYGRSKQEELNALLLLTLSNVFFIPAIILALYRRYFVEAVIYAYTMFFSAIYHACDASNLVYYCMLEYDLLSFADFLGSITSFWVTMLAMSHIPTKVRSFAQTVGAIGVAVGVEFDRHGVWTFAVPAGLSALVMFGSWIRFGILTICHLIYAFDGMTRTPTTFLYSHCLIALFQVLQCKRHRSLYPGKKYYLFHFLPGVILAVTGMVLFAFFETEDNYKYIHSCWHVAISLSIVFLLPRRQNKGKKTVEENTDSTFVDSVNIPVGTVNTVETDTNVPADLSVNS